MTTGVIHDETQVEPREASGSAVIPANRIIALQTPVELGDPQACQPQVELQRKGDSVLAVHIFCRCGERIVLECDLAS
jgi:hypothetical protein